MEKAKKPNKGSIIFFSFFILGFVWILVGRNISRNTLISEQILWSVAFIAGFLSVFIVIIYLLNKRKKEKNTSEIGIGFGLGFVVLGGLLCSFMIGSFVVFIGLFINQTFANEQTTTETYTIKSWLSSKSKKSSYASHEISIEVDGTPQTIFMEGNILIEKTKTITLTLQKGLFGYNVIKSKTANTNILGL